MAGVYGAVVQRAKEREPRRSLGGFPLRLPLSIDQ